MRSPRTPGKLRQAGLAAIVGGAALLATTVPALTAGAVTVDPSPVVAGETTPGFSSDPGEECPTYPGGEDSHRILVTLTGPNGETHADLMPALPDGIGGFSMPDGEWSTDWFTTIRLYEGGEVTGTVACLDAEGTPLGVEHTFTFDVLPDPEGPPPEPPEGEATIDAVLVDNTIGNYRLEITGTCPSDATGYDVVGTDAGDGFALAGTWTPGAPDRLIDTVITTVEAGTPPGHFSNIELTCSSPSGETHASTLVHLVAAQPCNTSDPEADADGDGLPNGREVGWWLPCEPDSNGNGVLDGDEPFDGWGGWLDPATAVRPEGVETSGVIEAGVTAESLAASPLTVKVTGSAGGFAATHGCDQVPFEGSMLAVHGPKAPVAHLHNPDPVVATLVVTLADGTVVELPVVSTTSVASDEGITGQCVLADEVVFDTGPLALHSGPVASIGFDTRVGALYVAGSTTPPEFQPDHAWTVSLLGADSEPVQGWTTRLADKFIPTFGLSAAFQISPETPVEEETPETPTTTVPEAPVETPVEPDVPVDVPDEPVVPATPSTPQELPRTGNEPFVAALGAALVGLGTAATRVSKRLVRS